MQARACEDNRRKRGPQKAAGLHQNSPRRVDRVTRHLLLVELSPRSCTQPQCFRWVGCEDSMFIVSGVRSGPEAQ